MGAWEPGSFAGSSTHGPRPTDVPDVHKVPLSHLFFDLLYPPAVVHQTQPNSTPTSPAPVTSTPTDNPVLLFFSFSKYLFCLHLSYPVHHLRSVILVFTLYIANRPCCYDAFPRLCRCFHLARPKCTRLSILLTCFPFHTLPSHPLPQVSLNQSLPNAFSTATKLSLMMRSYMCYRLIPSTFILRIIFFSFLVDFQLTFLASTGLGRESSFIEQLSILF